ncbi:hypothetical protein MPLA_930024 [Mesorhizobium sp. ORS 3359]|nr:hypothetical protein MPLA_930024 [Mesorhizobium sp. ORS 3359]
MCFSYENVYRRSMNALACCVISLLRSGDIRLSETVLDPNGSGRHHEPLNRGYQPHCLRSAIQNSA